jgi:hypothetical protein
MPIAAQTVCETCLMPVAWADLQPTGFGASGHCPACGELVLRPRRRPIAHDDLPRQVRRTEPRAS